MAELTYLSKQAEERGDFLVAFFYLYSVFEATLAAYVACRITEEEASHSKLFREVFEGKLSFIELARLRYLLDFKKVERAEEEYEYMRELSIRRNEFAHRLTYADTAETLAEFGRSMRSEVTAVRLAELLLDKETQDCLERLNKAVGKSH